MIVLLTPFETTTGLAAAIAAVNILIIIAIIFMERKNPESTLAWVLVLTFLPVVGLILNMIFSQNIARKQIFRLNPDEEKFVSSSLKKQMDAISTGKYEFVNEEAAEWRDMIRLNQRYDSAYFTQNNEVELFTDGREKFESLIADIENAKKSINIEYYIIKWDKVGIRLLKALEKKAKEGVEVRLLMETVGLPKARSKIQLEHTIGTCVGPTGRPMPRLSSSRATPLAASRPKADPPERQTAWTLSTVFSGRSRSVSREAGAPPRTSTPPVAPSGATITVQPVPASSSV